MTNLMICENLDLLSLWVPQIKRIILAFSDFPTYSEKVLLPKFPLPLQLVRKVTKNVKLKVTFLLLPGFPPN